jgi:cytochrome c2
MASLMWNHAPAMWSAMAKAGLRRPELTTEQAADLFAYFYEARYFEQPGDAGRGKQVFETKQCASCHGLATGVRGSPAKPVSEWNSLSDAILLAQEMWNHAAQMKAALAGKKVQWPLLTGQELTDLLVYVRNAPGARGRRAEFAPASTETGKMLFELKGCVKCHTGKLSLDNRFSNRTLTDFAASMWNHSIKMGGVQTLRSEEMRRLVGYLWSIQVFDERGNPRRGAQVFARNQCSSCHDNPSSGAPRLTGLEVSPLSMVANLWKHGPAMQQQMRNNHVPWPRFSGTDMADLIASLNVRK